MYESAERGGPKSLEEKIIEITEDNGGVFNTYEHKEQLIDLGYLRGEPQTMTH